MKNTIIIIFSIFISFSLKVNAQWQQTNLHYTGGIKCFVINGTNILAGTTGSNGAIFSSNNGNNWITANNGLPPNLDIKALANSGTNIFAGTDTAMFLTTNNGNSWSNISIGLHPISTDSNTYIRSIAISGSNIFAGTINGVFLSSNNGNNWASVSSSLPANTIIYSLIINGTNIFAGSAGAVYLSTNNGTSWNNVSTGITTATSINSFAISGSNIFAGTYEGVYLSTNNGSSWSAVNNGLTTASDKSINSLAIVGTTLYAATASGVHSTTNFGANWYLDTGVMSNFLLVNGVTIYSATSNGLYYRGFSSWVSTAISITDVLSLTIKDTNIFAGTNGSGAFLSTDSGNHWTPVGSGLTNGTVNSLLTSGNNIFAGAYNGTSASVFLSTNNGASWSNVSSGITGNYPITALAVNGIYIFAGESTSGGGTTGGIFVSTNNGTSWTRKVIGLPGNFTLYALAVKSGVIYAATDNGIWASGNNGNGWYSYAFPSTIIGHLTANSNFIYASTNGTTSNGIWRSSGAGFSQVFNIGLNSIYSLASNDTVVFAGTTAGIIVSSNNGINWCNVNNNMTTTLVRALAISSTVYAATGSVGTWVRPLSEMTFTIPTVSSIGSTTFCQGDSVVLTSSSAVGNVWSNGSTTQSTVAYTSGNYSVIYTNSNGCALPTNFITITVNPTHTSNTSASICQGNTYTFPDATTSTTSTIHTSHLNTFHSCDSSIVTTLTVNPIYTNNVSASICQGNTYTFPDATTSTTSTIHTSHLNTFHSCDSSIVTTLTVNPTYSSNTSASICQGNTYTFPDATTATTSTIHTSQFSTIHSCDSSIVTSLTVNPTYTNNVSTSICQGDTYTFPDATTATSTIVHTSHFSTITSCDSSIVTALTVNPTHTNNVSTSICQGNTYTFPDATTATTSIIHTSHLSTIHSCDSSIVTTLTVNPTYTNNVSASICQGDTYTFPDATTATSATLHTSHFNTINSCDSSIVTTLTINSLPNVTINLSSIDTLCQSTGVVNLTGETPIGGIYSGNGVFGNTFNSDSSGLGSQTITYTFTDLNTCSNSATGNIYVDVCTGINETTNNNLFSIYPNPTSGQFTVSLQTDNAEIRVTNLLGQQLLKTQTTQKTANLQLDNNGVYIVYVKTKQGTTTRKLIVNR